jgi:recombination protein RecR
VYSPAVERLITELAKLPGIGPRTAQRLTFHMLKLRPDEILPLAVAITEVKEKIGFCSRCFNLAEGELCTVCADTRRDQRVLCVVEQPFDIVTIERIDGDVEEVILATNPTMTGEATAMYVADMLPERVRVTRLASGLPVGGDLEYADELTLGRALVGRRSLRRGEE